VRLLLIGCLVLALAGCGGGASGNSVEARSAGADCGNLKGIASLPPPSFVPTAGNWVVMGSSSAQGKGAALREDTWAARLDSAFGGYATVHNIAAVGQTTYHAMSSSCTAASDRPAPVAGHNFDAAISFAPALVIISFPSNDAALGWDVEESVANILSLRGLFAQANVPTIVLSSQPRALPAVNKRALLEFNLRLAPELGPCFVDVYTPLVDGAGMLDARYDSGDGVHPNSDGHQVIFEAIERTLESGRCVTVQGYSPR